MAASSPATNPDTVDTDLATLDPADELDDPYIHIVSTEEFVETIEVASREQQ